NSLPQDEMLAQRMYSLTADVFRAVINLRWWSVSCPGNPGSHLAIREAAMSDTTSHRHPTHFDEKEFERRIPFKLIKTNLPGVYATPAPATDDYDPRTVHQSDLIRPGMTVRRPDSKAEPRL